MKRTIPLLLAAFLLSTLLSVPVQAAEESGPGRDSAYYPISVEEYTYGDFDELRIQKRMAELYFAYGSNINLEQMACRCPDACVVGPVFLEDYELLFRRGGFATIAPKAGSRVHGLLWSITPGCERSLDRLRGLSPLLR